MVTRNGRRTYGRRANRFHIGSGYRAVRPWFINSGAVPGNIHRENRVNRAERKNRQNYLHHRRDSGIDQFVAHGDRNGRRSGGDTELRQEIGDVPAYCAWADRKRVRDRAVTATID